MGLRARGVRKAFGRRVVLDGADLDVAPGEVVAITGTSGSGKSTLLHVVGGLEPADAGTIELGGERLTWRRADRVRRRQVGFVFQAFHLVPELTARENVRLAATLPGAPEGARERGEELLEQLGLAHVAASSPRELSGGEQQRVAIARALVTDPPVILADEPTGNLDADSGAVVLELLRTAAHDHGRAVAVVTHHDEVVAAADRAVAVSGGRVVQDGPLARAA